MQCHIAGQLSLPGRPAAQPVGGGILGEIAPRQCRGSGRLVAGRLIPAVQSLPGPGNGVQILLVGTFNGGQRRLPLGGIHLLQIVRQVVDLPAGAPRSHIAPPASAAASPAPAA